MRLMLRQQQLTSQSLDCVLWLEPRILENTE